MKLRRQMLALLVVVNLALGLGATIAIFSVADALLFRPLPYPHPQQLVSLEHGVLPKGYYHALTQRLRAQTLAAYEPGAALSLEQSGHLTSLHGAVVSTNFFRVLGVPPSLGRGFQADADQPGQNAVAVISHQLWQQQFGSNLEMVGQQITLGGIERRVVGVMPASFQFPSGATQFWVPLTLDPGNLEDTWERYAFLTVGRLHPGVTLQAARADFARAAAQAVQQFPYPVATGYASTYPLVSLHDSLFGSMRPVLRLMLGAAALVLLIACANAANLLLTQFAAERRDTAVRLALGAGAARVLRRFLGRSLRLALLGGGVGVLLAWWLLPLLVHRLPSDAAPPAAIGLDARVLLFALLLSLAAGIITGLIPSLRGSRTHLVASLRATASAPEPAGKLPLATLLLVGEIALALVVVIAGALVAQSLRSLTRQNPGFNPSHVSTLRLHPAASFCAVPERCTGFYRRVQSAVAALPGVQSAALVNRLPLAGNPPIGAAVFQDHPLLPGKPVPLIWANIVSPGYLRTAGIPLLAGRALRDSDSPASRKVALISAALARRLWPHASPLGKAVTTLNGNLPSWTVVGVVADVREFQLQGDPGFYQGEVYFPLAQAMASPPMAASMADLSLLLRSSAPPSAATLRRLILHLQSDTAIGPPRTLAGIVYASIAGPRTTAWLFGLFALLALAMAMLGVVAVTGEAVGQRAREFGVRLALGAKPAAICALVLRRALLLAGAGIGLGLLASWILSRFLTSLLFGVAPADPVTYGLAAVAVAAIVLFACYWPARRATKVDPVVVLRGD